MTPTEWLLDGTMIGLLLAVAVLSLHHPRIFAGAVLFIVYGLLLSFVWLRLGAPDVALAEAAIGAGLTGALIIGTLSRLAAEGRRRAGGETGAHRDGDMYRAADAAEDRTTAADIVVGIAAVLAFAGLALAALHLTASPSPLAGMVSAQLPESGLGNPVNAVLLNFRAFDTLLEKAVLVLALAGLWMLSSDAAWGGRAVNFVTAHEVEAPLVVLLKMLVPLVALTAFYLLLVGADEPGGAFQSGTVLAAIGILLVLARVMPPPAVDGRAIRWAVAAGFLVFVLAGFATLALDRGFMDFPPGAAKGFILGIELMLTLSVAATLFMLANGLPREEERRASR